MPNPNNLTKAKVIEELQKGFNEVIKCVQPVPETVFFKRLDSKWSIADNLEHLVLSLKPLTLAFRLPKFILFYFGKPNRPVRTYEELVTKYQAKLSAGGRAPSTFVPTSKVVSDKSLVIGTFKEENEKFIRSLGKWKEADLDRYLIPHPLLGKLYVREMLYFTIYHTQHHLRTIEKIATISTP